MQIQPDIATRLYADARTLTQPDPKAPPAAFGTGTDDGGPAFAFVDALREAETTVRAGLSGKADPQAVVQALAETEIAVQTAVAVRDRVVEAYQEILRMPV